jgi:hypothetical protein
MSHLSNVILHAGPGVMPTVSEYAARVLLHAVAFVGLAVLVPGRLVATRALRATLDPEGRAGSADR